MEPVLPLQLQGLRLALEQALPSGGPSSEKVGLPWAPGDQVSARVEALRPNQRMLLRIGEFLFDAPRPRGLDAGQTVTLRFVAADASRPTFALEQSIPPGRAQVTNVAISASARELDVLVRSLMPERMQGPDFVKAASPLLPAPGDPHRLAMALQSSLEGSGLFYESHLLEWMRGRWPIERLRNEPQFHLPAPRRSEIAAPEESPRLNDERLDMPAEADRKASAAGGDSIVAYDALQHLKLQLHVVDHRQVTWQGQLWPGQSAEWKVDEPPEQRAAEESPEWSSRLHLTMPRLGGITAQLVLTDRSLRMQVQVETTATREALTGAGDDLLQRLRDAGIELRAFQVLDATG